MSCSEAGVPVISRAGGVVGGGSGVSVSGGTGVSVGGGSGVFVSGGIGVSVGGGSVVGGIRVGVGITFVDVGITPLSRVRVGGTGVQVMKILAVGVFRALAVGVEMISSGEGVKLGMYSRISTAVIATAVLIGLEKAESTISCGSISDELSVLGFARAAADTMQMRLNPNTPAEKTVSGAEYLRIFKLASLYLRQMKGGCCMERRVWKRRKGSSLLQV